MGITFIYVTHDQKEALTMSDALRVLGGSPAAASVPAEEPLAS